MLMEEAPKCLLKTIEDLHVVWRFWKLQFMNAERYIYVVDQYMLNIYWYKFRMEVSIYSWLVNVFFYVVLMSML